MITLSDMLEAVKQHEKKLQELLKLLKKTTNDNVDTVTLQLSLFIAIDDDSDEEILNNIKAILASIDDVKDLNKSDEIHQTIKAELAALKKLLEEYVLENHADNAKKDSQGNVIITVPEGDDEISGLTGGYGGFSDLSISSYSIESLQQLDDSDISSNSGLDYQQADDNYSDKNSTATILLKTNGDKKEDSQQPSIFLQKNAGISLGSIVLTPKKKSIIVIDVHLNRFIAEFGKLDDIDIKEIVTDLKECYQRIKKSPSLSNFHDMEELMDDIDSDDDVKQLFNNVKNKLLDSKQLHFTGEQIQLDKKQRALGKHQWAMVKKCNSVISRVNDIKSRLEYLKKGDNLLIYNGSKEGLDDLIDKLAQVTDSYRNLYRPGSLFKAIKDTGIISVITGSKITEPYFVRESKLLVKELQDFVGEKNETEINELIKESKEVTQESWDQRFGG